MSLTEILLCVVAGFSLLGFIVLSIINVVLLRELSLAHSLLKSAVVYLTRIDQVSMTTMHALDSMASTFIGAFQNRPDAGPIRGSENFDDLKSSFEDDLRDMEDDEDDKLF